MLSFIADPVHRKNVGLLVKLFGCSLVISLVIKYGIPALFPEFSRSISQLPLDSVATIAILTPSLVIAIVLAYKSNSSQNLI